MKRTQKTKTPTPVNKTENIKQVEKKENNNNNENSVIKEFEKYSFPALIVLILLIGFLAFPDYISIKKIYYFKDVGSDIINQNFPARIERENLLEEEKNPTWSFYSGMGENKYRPRYIGPIMIIREAINSIEKSIFGKHYFIYSKFLNMFIWYILFSGIVAFFYFRTIGFTKSTALIGALIFAYLGYTVLGSSWNYSGIVMNGIILLFAFEQLYIKNRWYFMPFAVSYIASNPYYFYWFAVFILTYLLFRFYTREEKLKNIFIVFTKMFIFGLIGLLLNIIDIFTTYSKVLNGPRVAHDVSTISSGGNAEVFDIENFSEQLTSVFRLFSNDILGNGSSFKGWNNYLEAPIFYCGILTLILIPQIFGLLSKRNKIGYGILLGAWLLTVFIPPLRNALHLYAGNYYKGVYDFVISFTLLFAGISALNEIIKSKTINIKLLAATSAGLLLILYIPWNENIELIIDKEIRTVATFLIIIYSGILFMISKPKFSLYAPILLLITIFIELVYMSGSTVNKRVAYKKINFEKTLGGFKDGTVNAVEYIKQKDNSFFRAEKDFSSGTAQHGSINDAQAQGYFGTASYASFNQYYYIRFLQESGAIPKGDEIKTRWAPGVRGIPLLMSFASVKYYFTKTENNALENMGYSFVKQFDDVRLLKNKYSLPLGFCYDKFIKKEEFDKLGNVFAKSAMLLSGFVLEKEDENKIDLSKFKELTASDSISGFTFNFGKYDTLVYELRKDTMQLTSFKNSHITGTIDMSSTKMLFFSIPFDENWEILIDNKPVEKFITNLGFIGVLVDQGKHEVELKYTSRFQNLNYIFIAIAYIILILMLVFKNKTTFLKIKTEPNP